MKSALAAVLGSGLALLLIQPAFAQDSRVDDESVRWMDAGMAQQRLLTRAVRLGASGYTDTLFVGHTSVGPYVNNPFHVGVGPYRPGVGGNYDGMWDFDTYDGGAIDSMQGWIQQVNPNTRTSGTIADQQRPWMCLDWGNRMNAGPVQGRTPGIVSAWHADDGVYALRAGQSSSNSWAPLAGSKSAWCGLRAGDDFTVVDSTDLGGTGNHINGETVIGRYGDGVYTTNKNFPGYSNQWDQMLFRDVRVATGGALMVSFLYETQMDHRANTAEATCSGWFDRDPLSMQQGGGGAGASNFISASAYLGATARSGPIDSFMVYVGVPTDPTACRYSDGLAPRPVFDLKRRWFSEVIAIDKPYKEILSTFGHDSVYRSAPFTAILSNVDIQPMLDAQGATDGGGVIRVVFRSKTNANYSDETNTGGSFNSTNKGAVRIDEVAITGLATSGFETAREINNTIEAPESSLPGPAVGEGYALRSWKATGKPPKLMAHTHPLSGGDIGPGNYYNPLVYEDLCGAADSPLRQCNINNVVISSTDHDLGEAAGGPIGTPFWQNRNGFISPTINLVTPTSGVNNMGLDRYHVETNDDWRIFYDMYSGMMSSTYGNVWGNSILSYPTTQKNGAKVWGDVGYFTGVWVNGTKECFLMSDVLGWSISTSNPSGIPDSCKLFIFREQRCITWGVTTNCSPTYGHYTDNVALVLPPSRSGPDYTITADLDQWINDTFPFNEDPLLPGTSAFDTCSALIKTGVNLAPTTGDALRFDVPGDTTVVAAFSWYSPIRLDLVFRILPGPGNHVVVGNRASALRKVPTSGGPAAPGDGSFWGEYMADPGAFSKGTHAGGWNPDTWNSARCDSAERNLFPADGRQANLGGLVEGRWASMYHESDPRFATLGILKNRCFLSGTLPEQPIDNTNITCSSVPAWVTENAAAVGYDGQQQTREYTKIIPDGLLTPGSHVEYFFRMSWIDFPSSFVAMPDTEYIYPQPREGPNYDGHRWQQFGVLPDRWKAAEYGGLGSACAFFVDAADGSGAERVWVGIMDSIGATATAKYGAHNGWHATDAYVAPDGSHDYTNQRVGNDPTIAVWKHGGQPGTTWDMYGVKGGASYRTPAGSLGSRLANRTGMGLMAGKESRQGPTPLMLRTYYRLVCLSTGPLAAGVLGPFANCSQNDIALLQDFLTFEADPDYPRGIWVMGRGFVEGNTGVDAAHTGFLANQLAVSLRDPSYFLSSGATALYPDLIPTSTTSETGAIYSVRNACLFTNDVLEVNTSVTGATAASHYQNLGGAGPYVSGVFAPSTSVHPYVSLVDGWDTGDLFSRGGTDTWGRLSYFCNVFTNVFGSVCAYLSPPFGGGCEPAGVDPADPLVPIRDFVALRNNPLVSGVAAPRLGLARPDRVEARVYDLAGRRVRVLAEREYAAGEHTLVWDGTDDRGQSLPHGVYFTSVRYVRGGFHDERKLTILR
jgi:hypothetical protein